MPIETKPEPELENKPPDLCAYTIDELEDMRAGLIEAINILAPIMKPPREYAETLAAIDSELVERVLLE